MHYYTRRAARGKGEAEHSRMSEEKRKRPRTRKPVPEKPGKVILSKKDVERKKRFRKADWDKEAGK